MFHEFSFVFPVCSKRIAVRIQIIMEMQVAFTIRSRMPRHHILMYQVSYTLTALKCNIVIFYVNVRDNTIINDDPFSQSVYS